MSTSDPAKHGAEQNPRKHFNLRKVGSAPLNDPGINAVTLSQTERLTMEGLAKRLTIDAVVEPAQFVEAAHLLGRGLPDTLVRALYRLETRGPALLIENMPMGPIGPTPADAINSDTHTTTLCLASAIVLGGVGHLAGFEGESGGRIAQCICPVRDHAGEQASTGRVNLESHTEQAFNSRTKPDFFSLSALRGDPNAATLLLSARAVLEALPSRAIRLLRDPMYSTTVDGSFVRSGVQNSVRGPMPVLSGNDEDPTIVFDDDLQYSDSAAHTSALNMVRKLWAHERSSVVLGPGDMLIVDNSRVVHGRSEFFPQYDGGDRWLVRLQVHKSLAATRFARSGVSPIVGNCGV